MNQKTKPEADSRGSFSSKIIATPEVNRNQNIPSKVHSPLPSFGINRFLGKNESESSKQRVMHQIEDKWTKLVKINTMKFHAIDRDHLGTMWVASFENLHRQPRERQLSIILWSFNSLPRYSIISNILESFINCCLLAFPDLLVNPLVPFPPGQSREGPCGTSKSSSCQRNPRANLGCPSICWSSSLLSDASKYPSIPRWSSYIERIDGHGFQPLYTIQHKC